MPRHAWVDSAGTLDHVTARGPQRGVLVIDATDREQLCTASGMRAGDRSW